MRTHRAPRHAFYSILPLSTVAVIVALAGGGEPTTTSEPQAATAVIAEPTATPAVDTASAITDAELVAMSIASYDR